MYRASLVIAACLLAVGSLCAAPPNDSFAARLPLGSDVNRTVTASNVDATLEPDENDIDSIGGASVWWAWTAPTTAWVSVDTIGSEIDTVLAVCADGPAIADTFVVGFNDESGDPSAPFGSSRVIFRATAGTAYHIAVHGFLGEQGNVTLNLHSGVTPPIRISSVTLTPASVNVTTVAQTITMDIGIESDAGFSEGEVAVHKANFSSVAEVPITTAARISGTPMAGIYRVSIPAPRYSAPGTWFLEIAVSDLNGDQAVFGRGVSAIFEYDHVLTTGIPTLISVANTGQVDGVAPNLESFSRTPAAVSVVVSQATLTFTFRVTDTLSGFGGATLTLFTPGGEALVALPVTAANRILGTALDGTYRVIFALPVKMPTGTWSASLLVRDLTGNPSLYDGALNGLDFPLGAASAEWSVTGAPNSYWAWIYPNLTTTAGAGPTQDIDSDGISNLHEFAFGLAPDQNDSGNAGLVSLLDASGMPVVSIDAGVLSIDFVRRVADSLSGLTYVPQFGDLTGLWQNATGGVVTPTNELFERVSVTDGPAPGGSRFGRVKVILAE